jgi:hypothetical protein
MTISVVMLRDERGEDGTPWRRGLSYTASDKFARWLIQIGSAYDTPGATTPGLTDQEGANVIASGAATAGNTTLTAAQFSALSGSHVFESTGSGCSIPASSIDYLHDTRVLLANASYLFGTAAASPTVFGRIDKTTGAFTALTAALLTENGSTGATQSTSSHINCAQFIDANTIILVTSADNNFNGIIYRIVTTDGWANIGNCTATIVCHLVDNITTGGTSSSVNPNGNRALTSLSLMVDGSRVMFAEYNGTTGPGRVRVLKSEDAGATWSVYWTMNGTGVLAQGTMRHFHCIQKNPYTGDYWIVAGDAAMPYQTSQSGVAGVCDSATLVISSTLPALTDNIGFVALKASPPTGVKAVQIGFFWKGTGFVFTADGAYYTTDVGAGDFGCLIAGIYRANNSATATVCVSRRGFDGSNFSGYIGGIDNAGRLCFNAFSDVNPNNTTTDITPYVPLWTGTPDGSSWALAGAYMCKISSGNTGLLYAFVYDQYADKFYMSCQLGAGKGSTNTNYKTAVFSLSSTPHTRDKPEIVHPVYWVSPTGTDSTAASTKYGQQGWGPGAPWQGVGYACTGNRITYGGRVMVVSSGDYYAEGGAYAAVTNPYGTFTAAWTANSFAGVAMTPVELDFRSVTGYVRWGYSTYITSGSWCIANIQTMPLRVVGGRWDIVEFTGTATGVNGTGMFLFNTFGGTAVVNSTFEAESVVSYRYTQTGNSAGVTTRSGIFHIGVGGLLYYNKCNLSYFNIINELQCAVGQQAVVKLRDSAFTDINYGFADISTSPMLTVYDISYSHLDTKGAPWSLSGATSIPLLPSQFKVKNSAVLIDATATALGYTHFSAASWTNSYALVAQTLTVTGHSSVTYGGVATIQGNQVTLTAGGGTPFSATSVGQFVVVAGISYNGADGLVRITEFTSATVVVGDIIRPLTTASVSTSQWAICQAQKPAFYNCVLNAPVNPGGFNPFPEPDAPCENIYTVPWGVVTNQGKARAGYYPSDYRNGNFYDPAYPNVGPRVILPAIGNLV